jgi:hypothetical protein
MYYCPTFAGINVINSPRIQISRQMHCKNPWYRVRLGKYGHNLLFSHLLFAMHLLFSHYSHKYISVNQIFYVIILSMEAEVFNKPFVCWIIYQCICKNFEEKFSRLWHTLPHAWGKFGHSVNSVIQKNWKSKFGEKVIYVLYFPGRRCAILSLENLLKLDIIDTLKKIDKSHK